MRKFIEEIKNKGLVFASWYGVSNPFGGSSFETVDGIVERVTAVINSAIYLSALIAVIIIVYGAYNIIISAGDSDKVETGQKAIQNSIIGMIVVFLAATIIKFVVTEILK